MYQGIYEELVTKLINIKLNELDKNSFQIKTTLIDKEEAEFLFEINNAVSGKENDSSWESLFIEAISNFLLEDENTPGEIDKEEADWLFEKINGDGQIDSIEKNLLLNLKNKAKSFPTNLESLLN